jgi:UDPglucose 6-dehydrogenase
MNDTIGIIGGGFVGSATAWAFHPTHEVKVYDKDPKASTHTFEEAANSDFIFICVPTPPKEDWTTDLSIVESIFEKLKPRTRSQQILIKSTVLPGTCRRMSEKYGIKVSSNPEFLTERRAKWDFINAAQILIGSDDPEDASKIQGLYEQRFNSMKYTITDTVTSELIKYTLNCFFATKVSFMNEVKMLSNKIGADWGKLIEGFTSDSRIGDSHVDVPGPDGKLGFGGKCFPKDLNALMELFRKNDIDPLVMQAAWERNQKIRT